MLILGYVKVERAPQGEYLKKITLPGLAIGGKNIPPLKNEISESDENGYLV